MQDFADIVARQGEFNHWLTKDHLLATVNGPQFEKTGRVHDWRNYIDSWLIEQWHTLDLNARIALWYMAEKRASAEDWD